jgi:hypothetical protein
MVISSPLIVTHDHATAYVVTETIRPVNLTRCAVFQLGQVQS